MNITDANISSLIQERKQNKDTIKAINLNSFNIHSLTISYLWTNVEYLSLKNNLLQDINFISYFPMLLYLDISNNSIEDFELLNTYNSYAYLGLTAPRNFLEKKILTIKNLNVGILDLEIQNESYKELIIKNNPNVLLFNRNFYSYNEKITLIEKLNSKMNHSLKSLTPLSYYQSLKQDLLKLPNSSTIRNYHKYTVIDNNPLNPALKELIAFIKDYNNKMVEISMSSKRKEAKEKERLTLTNTKDNIQDNANILRYENGNDNENSLYLMQKYERRKLILLSKYYQRIANYNNNTKADEEYFNYHCHLITKACNIEGIHLDVSLFKLTTIQLQLLVLSILLLYIIGVLSKEIAIEILYSFYIKYNIIPGDSFNLLKKQIIKIFQKDYFYLICFFYDINDHLASLCKQLKLSKRKNERNQIDYGVVKYEELRKSLKMLGLTTEISSLQVYHQKISQFLYCKEINNRLDLIQSLMLKFVNEKNIFNEILQIIQYVNDFFISNHHFEDLLIKDLSYDYRIFNEIKELMYKNIKASKDSLSEKKFFKIKLRTMSNKYLFLSTKFANFLSIGTKTNVKTNLFCYKTPSHALKHSAMDFYPDEFNREEKEKSMRLMNELKSFIKIKPEKKPKKLNEVLSQSQCQTNLLFNQKGSDKSSNGYTSKLNLFSNAKQKSNSNSPVFSYKNVSKESMSKSMTQMKQKKIKELPKIKGIKQTKVSLLKRNCFNQDLISLQDKKKFLLRDTAMLGYKYEPSASSRAANFSMFNITKIC